MPFDLGKQFQVSYFRLTDFGKLSHLYFILFFSPYPSKFANSVLFTMSLFKKKKRVNYRFSTDAGRKCAVEKLAFTAIIKTLLREAE